ncbi:MAG: SIS domain-containing protein [Proteobacteria bacterium]|nr:SIS domain-containing protein [Pseudomonadota bacterium]
MCGIAGMLYDRRRQVELDWAALSAALAALRETPLDAADHRPFDAIMARFEALSADLREFSTFEALRANAERHTLLEQAGAALAQWEQTSHIAVLEASVNTELLERWNAVWLRARDLAWQMERDVLESLRQVDALLPPATNGSKAAFEAWKLAAILENIGRLEVRGRDSLGLSIMCTFPTQASLQAFESELEAQGLKERYQARTAVADFVDSAIALDAAQPSPSLVFTFKVALEVGALGDNVAHLTQTIRGDLVFWLACGASSTETNMFSHTRWASNGIISEPNCHPVNNETLGAETGAAPSESAPSPWIMAALNGDVDNYQELLKDLAQETGRVISPRITTDTKVIPVEVGQRLAESGDMLTAFCRAVSKFEGSFAIALHSTSDPHRTWLALRGSGQALFVGLARHGYVFASELYGVVEQTARFIRMDGTTERIPGDPSSAGQIFVLDARAIDGLSGIEAYAFDGTRLALTPETVRTAEITTRDINRGSHEHFLLKEISESPVSIEKTLQGKFFLGDATARLNLGEEVFPEKVAARIRDGSIRRVVLIGQGTAAIAGNAIASMMERSLSGAAVSVTSVKASELSGYGMNADMRDTLIVAISQSGTTTDTNRTVDMARTRGAAAICIVNRRNSDLVYKVDGVLYTSDGRDIEMSVASTKAFYSQVVAGYLISLELALLLGTLSEAQVHDELAELQRLPDKMRHVLANQDPIRELAEHWATKRRDWAVVGSGSTRAAAEEIRIKLSELCYKSIATDFIEDKKHIDLSSEPLTLVCAAGLPLMALRDAVKEVAIFKSHKSVPIVVTSEGFDAFEPYAAGVIYVPRASENASALLNTIVGHLWGYHCARAIDRGAAQLRHARSVVVNLLASNQPETLGAFDKLRTIARNVHGDMARGLYNSSLSVDTGAMLSTLFSFIRGQRSLGQFSAEFQAQGTPGRLLEVLVTNLTQAINELSRPIDAIKHQAKTVTVGISRTEESYEGVLFETLRACNATIDSVPYRDLVMLRAITPAVRAVAGCTTYEVRGLGTLGQPLPESTVRAQSKKGVSGDLISRADSTHALHGTKEQVVRNRALFIGLGRKDQRPILIVPLLPSGQVERLVLLHLEFADQMGLDEKAALLSGTQRYEDLRSQITETDLEWTDALLEPLTVAQLVTAPVEKLAEHVISHALTHARP